MDVVSLDGSLLSGQGEELFYRELMENSCLLWQIGCSDLSVCTCSLMANLEIIEIIHNGCDEISLLLKKSFSDSHTRFIVELLTREYRKNTETHHDY